jgi:hypothetical protein
MQLFRPFTLVLALSLPVLPAVAQSSSSTAPTQDQSSSQSSSSQDQDQTQAQPSGETQGQMSVQNRIRMRREQRRATAIHDAYDHRFETYVNLGYQRFRPGTYLQRVTFYAWDTGLTRYYSERLGVNLEARGYFGTAFTGVQGFSTGGFTRPRISQYNVMGGPTYRFYVQPKYAISGRAQAGWALGNFSGDTGPFTPAELGLYPDASTFVGNVAVIGDYNISPTLALRLAGDYSFTRFGSMMQESPGFTIGFVYRFGRQ